MHIYHRWDDIRRILCLGDARQNDRRNEHAQMPQ
jgi:hypothetical protein